MSRRLWRCRNPACPEPHGAVLGQLTLDGGLVLRPTVSACRCFLDSHRAIIICAACGVEREFRGVAVIWTVSLGL